MEKKHQHVEMIEEYLKIGGDYQYFDNHGFLTRCRECVYFEDEKDRVVRWCGKINKFTTSEEYCSWAKRKEDEGGQNTTEEENV